MNKRTLEQLKAEEEIMNEIKDARMGIKDLERELDYMYAREPDEWKYIAYLEHSVKELYKKLDKLDEAN